MEELRNYELMYKNASFKSLIGKYLLRQSKSIEEIFKSQEDSEILCNKFIFE